MSTVSRGFKGRRRPSVELPPGQYLVEDFPVLSAGPTPSIERKDWELVITSETDTQRRWDWDGFRNLPSEQVTVDLHCVTHWSKLQTRWEGVSLDTLLEGVETSAGFALVTSYGGYTTNLPLEDLTDGKAWIAFRFDGKELEAEHGGPARLLVPHLEEAVYVEELDVLPEHGRRGLGARLLERVCAWAQAQGSAAVTLSTFRDVPWNGPFYRRHGFRDLEPAEWTPGMQAIPEQEAQHGLAVEARVFMRRELDEVAPT